MSARMSARTSDGNPHSVHRPFPLPDPDPNKNRDAPVRAHEEQEPSQEFPVRAVTDAERLNGMPVDAWCEGVRMVTKQRAHTRPFGAPLRKLLDAIAMHKPADADAVEWSRSAGSRYAQACAGKTLSPFGFDDWLNSGQPERPSGIQRRGPEVQPAPAEGRAWKVGQ